MEAKHTPGPWFALSGGNVTRNTGPHWAAAGIYIAQVDQKSMSCEANARLIAAAPELAEACQALISLVNGPMPINWNTVADVHILARAALRKAGILED